MAGESPLLPGNSVLNEDHVSNTNGTLTIVKLGDDERRALRWLAPLLIVVGFNLAATLFLWDAYHAMSVNYLLVYNHQIKVEAYLAAHGAPVDKFGEPLPLPK